MCAGWVGPEAAGLHPDLVGPWRGPAAGRPWPDCNSESPSEEVGGFVGAPTCTDTLLGNSWGSREGTCPLPKPVTPAGRNAAPKSGQGTFPLGLSLGPPPSNRPSRKAPSADWPCTCHPSSLREGTEAGGPSDLPATAHLGRVRPRPSSAGPGERRSPDTLPVARAAPSKLPFFLAAALEDGDTVARPSTGQLGLLSSAVTAASCSGRRSGQCPGPGRALSRCPPGLSGPLWGIPWLCPRPRPPGVCVL